MKNNRIYDDLAEFLTNMVKQGATDDELTRGIMFSADVIKSYNDNKVGEIFNKYMGDKSNESIYDLLSEINDGYDGYLCIVENLTSDYRFDDEKFRCRGSATEEKCSECIQRYLNEVK